MVSLLLEIGQCELALNSIDDVKLFGYTLYEFYIKLLFKMRLSFMQFSLKKSSVTTIIKSYNVKSHVCARRYIDLMKFISRLLDFI